MKRELNNLIRVIFTVLILHISVLTVNSQTRIQGNVIDSTTREAIIGATIKCEDNQAGISTDQNGRFSFEVDKPSREIVVTAIGYIPQRIVIDSVSSLIEVMLKQDNFHIEAVEINKKKKYANRNPATELIDLVIRNKSQNKLEKKDSLYYEQYEKLKFGIVDPKSVFGRGTKNLSFFYNNVDRDVLEGKDVLSIYMQESLSDNYVQQNPSQTKKIIKVEEKTEFDAKYVNNPNIQSFMGYMFQPVDIYEESIYFINKQFLSPIASNAKTFYKYYVKDTI